MKNKGFTLIELLAVILIIGVIATISTPAVINIINSSRQKAYDKQIEMIKDAASRWAADNYKDTRTCISIQDLKEAGYLNNNSIRNPKTNEELNGSVQIVDNEYTYIDELCDNEADYAETSQNIE